MINHGGVAVGKSPNIPYWGSRSANRAWPDVIAYLQVTFKIPEVAASTEVD